LPAVLKYKYQRKGDPSEELVITKWNENCRFGNVESEHLGCAIEKYSSKKTSKAMMTELALRIMS
jgi:hypothetical protein